MANCILAHFAGLEDPRMERKKLHALNDILFLVVSAMLSGAEGWEAIEEFGYEKLDWLRKLIALKNGVPSADCIAYVMSRLSVNQVQDCFRSLSKEITEKLNIRPIAMDGKTSRGSRDRKRNRSALHLVSAWACEAGMVLGQEVVDGKSNEIKAIPNLLEVLELNGCLVTLDAMGCQTDLAEKIVDKGADYVIGLKGNQGNLHESVKDFFMTAENNGFKGVEYASYEELDKEHGRLERRRYWITECLNTIEGKERWKGLCSIGMVIRQPLEEGKPEERRYFIASIGADAALFAKAARGHWGIENRLHWRLDVTLREDACRIRKGAAPAILSTIRHLCLGLLDRDPLRGSLAKKRRKAAWNDAYRTNLLFGQNF